MPVRRRIAICAIVAALTAAPTGAAFAQKVLKQVPPPGTLKAGQVVLVDDGSCGAGMIKQITGGNNFSGGAPSAGGGPARQTTCVRRK
jgi:hypothetical protein